MTLTLARDKSGHFWQVDGSGPLIEVDMSYDRKEQHWLVSSVWQNDIPIVLTDAQREQIEAWHDANVLYDWSE
jgi:hypothetical protein